MSTRHAGPILYADDDQDDWLLMELAHRQSRLECPIVFVSDGHDIIQYLGNGDALSPAIILLDLNMPRLGGRETLEWLKRQPSFRRIPVIMLTTSAERTDVNDMYALGASSYIVKPPSSVGLVGLLDAIEQYCFGRPPSQEFDSRDTPIPAETRAGGGGGGRWPAAQASGAGATGR